MEDYPDHSGGSMWLQILYKVKEMARESDNRGVWKMLAAGSEDKGMRHEPRRVQGLREAQRQKWLSEPRHKKCNLWREVLLFMNFILQKWKTTTLKGSRRHLYRNQHKI